MRVVRLWGNAVYSKKQKFNVLNSLIVCSIKTLSRNSGGGFHPRATPYKKARFDIPFLELRRFILLVERLYL